MSDTSPDGRPPDTPPTRVTLRVGITGHRLDKLPDTDLPVLRTRLAEVFGSLEARVLRLRQHRTGRPTAREAPQIRLVSALADGADRLAVEAAPRHWPLDVLLPMPRAEYRRDFIADGGETSASAAAFDVLLARAQTVTELPMARTRPGASPPPRARQYAALGHALVRQVDCLVAVWDGRPPKGPGGTANVVAEAVELGVPVLWIDPAEPTTTHRIVSLSDGNLARPILGGADDAALEAMLMEIVDVAPA